MSWKKYFNVQGSAFNPGNQPPTSNTRGVTTSKFSSYLNEVYTGTPNRVDRYIQYDQMDMDSEVNAALDILSEFSSQPEPTTTQSCQAPTRDASCQGP